MQIPHQNIKPQNAYFRAFKRGKVDENILKTLSVNKEQINVLFKYTNKIFHQYINPQRKVSEDAYKVHGYSDKFLADKKTFSQIAKDFLNFIKDKKIIIHNAPFDLSFLNYELKLAGYTEIDKKNVIDTLELARLKFPGALNSLDALCKRFNIDNSKREKHSALVDCNLLKEVYINLLDQKEPKLNLTNSESNYTKMNTNVASRSKASRKILSIKDEEIKLHKEYLRSSLPKNYYK